MALVDLTVPLISQSSPVISTHLDEYTDEYTETDQLERNFGENCDVKDADVARSSYSNVAAATVTSMAYLPQTSVLCELRHEAFEDCVRSGQLDSGLVSKWQPKDRVDITAHILDI